MHVWSVFTPLYSTFAFDHRDDFSSSLWSTDFIISALLRLAFVFLTAGGVAPVPDLTGGQHQPMRHVTPDIWSHFWGRRTVWTDCRNMSRQEKKVNLSDTLEKENLVEIVQVHSDDTSSKSRWRFRWEDLENHQTEHLRSGFTQRNRSLSSKALKKKPPLLFVNWCSFPAFKWGFMPKKKKKEPNLCKSVVKQNISNPQRSVPSEHTH